jgi:small GTP-binding protein
MESYKIVVLGSGGVGKSALIIQHVQGHFVTSYDPTIEDSHKKTMTVDGRDISLDILDTAGQDDFAPVRSTYMRSGNGFMVVFAVNDQNSFNQVDTFQEQIRAAAERDDVPIVVCGNKCDLKERIVTKDAAEQLCRECHLTYFDTSAMKNMNVAESFTELCRQMRKQNPAAASDVKEASPAAAKGDSSKSEASGEGGCCNVA